MNAVWGNLSPAAQDRVVWTFALFIGCMVAVAWLMFRSRRLGRQRWEETHRRRDQALPQIAAELDLQFTEDPQEVQQDQLRTACRINDRFTHSFRNLVFGTLDNDAVLVADDRYEYTSKRRRHIVARTVLVFPKLMSAIPDFELRPRGASNWLARLHRKVGHGIVTALIGNLPAELDFPESPRFQQAYVVTGPDPASARLRFTADVLEFLTSSRGWSIRARDGQLVIFRRLHDTGATMTWNAALNYHHEDLWEAEVYPAMLADAVALRRQLVGQRVSQIAEAHQLAGGPISPKDLPPGVVDD